MLKFDTINMHQSSRVIQLFDIIELVSDNDFEWSVVDFHGVGQAPNGLAMPAFEELVRSSLLGYRMMWPELQEFARNLQQTMECLIIAADSIDVISESQLDVDDYSECRLVIEAIDSTKWRVGELGGIDMFRFRHLQDGVESSSDG